MAISEPLNVITYSGYQGEERPTAFVLRGERIEVAEILEKRIEEDRDSRERKRYFIIKGSDGLVHTLAYHESTGEWSRR